MGTEENMEGEVCKNVLAALVLRRAETAKDSGMIEENGLSPLTSSYLRLAIHVRLKNYFDFLPKPTPECDKQAEALTTSEEEMLRSLLKADIEKLDVNERFNARLRTLRYFDQEAANIWTKLNTHGRDDLIASKTLRTGRKLDFAKKKVRFYEAGSLGPSLPPERDKDLKEENDGRVYYS